MQIFHVLVDKMDGFSALSSISVEKSFRTRQEAQQYIDEQLSDIDPDLIDIQYSYLDIDNQFEKALTNLIYETFVDGFCSPSTYNDTILNSPEEEFEKDKEYFQQKIENLLKTYLGNK